MAALSLRTFSLPVDFAVTRSAERNQVPPRVASQPAPGLDVMDVEVLRRSAVLASPAVPVEDLFSKLVVSLPIKWRAARWS